MTKPTLKDFIDNPNKAMRNGYYPDFMSCGALSANSFSLQSIKYVNHLFIDFIRGEVIELPKNIFLLIIYIFALFSFPILFPFCWCVVWIARKKHYQNMEKTIEREKIAQQKVIDDFFVNTNRIKYD